MKDDDEGGGEGSDESVMQVILGVWGFWGWTNRWKDICDCRVAFMTENSTLRMSKSTSKSSLNKESFDRIPNIQK